MKRMLILGGLAVLAATTLAAKPASADECRDGRYVAPDAGRSYDYGYARNRSFAEEYNRDYRRDNERNEHRDRNDRDRNDHRDGRDRR